MKELITSYWYNSKKVNDVHVIVLHNFSKKKLSKSKVNVLSITTYIYNPLFYIRKPSLCYKL